MRSRDYVPFMEQHRLCIKLGRNSNNITQQRLDPLARYNSSTKRQAEAPSRPVASTLNVKSRCGVKRVISGKQSSW